MAESPRSKPAQTPNTRPQAGEVASLGKVIEALRAEEAKYRDIDYSLRLTTLSFDPKAPKAPGKIESSETRRVVSQGERVWFQNDTTAHFHDTERHNAESSAFDGERTRSVIADNCANIHLGRFEHPGVYPAHTIPLIHYQLNFPLSVYLSGGDAIHAHPKYGHFSRESGSVTEFPKVEASVEREEPVDGIRCVKIRVNRWYYSNDAPVLQYLWLALDRNDLCLKEQLFPQKAEPGDLPIHEMHAEDLREIKPGLWFPSKITVSDFDREALRLKKQVIWRRSETIVEKAHLNPSQDLAFFRDIQIPKGLPVFTIQGDKLLGSSLPQPVGNEAEEKAKLDEVVAKVHKEELKYNNLEVRCAVDYAHVGSETLMGGLITKQTKVNRSVARGALGFFSARENSVTLGGSTNQLEERSAFDGEWTRGLYRSMQDHEREQRWASLRKGGGEKAEGRGDGIPLLRPHTFLLRDDWLYGPLADLLVSPWHDKINKYRLRFRYCGEEEFNGRPCVKLRGDVSYGEGRPPGSYIALWLAIDRNYIPIKLEHYGGNFGLKTMPVGINLSEDLREIAPGVWYPYRSVMMSFEGWQDLARRRITLNWKRTYLVASTSPFPQLDISLFHEIVVPPETTVFVNDEAGGNVGRYMQKNEGVAEITRARYLSFLSEAQILDDEQKARQSAIEALIGKPAPEFPEGAQWLNGKPLTWASLRGKVVILDFWADWCGPCRNDFPRLSLLHEQREINGLTIIGVHPPGSEMESIKKVIDEFHLNYPICIDIVSQDKVKAWGKLFGELAVRSIPRAVAVDGQGKIVAGGRLEDVLSKANGLVNKK